MTTKEAITTIERMIDKLNTEEDGYSVSSIDNQSLPLLTEAINALKAVEQLEAYCAEWESNLTPSDSEELFEIVDSIKSILKEEE